MAVLTSDVALIKRIVRCGVRIPVAYAEAKSLVDPSAGCAVLDIGGGVAIFAGKDDPLNKAIGLGFAGAVSEPEIDGVEQFYGERGTAPTFDVSPLAHGSLLAHLGRRGYHVHEIENVWVRSLQEEVSEPATDAVVERSAPADRESWATACVAGFGLAEEFLPLGRAIHASACTFCIRADGRPVAAGALSMADGVAWLFATSTLPAYRSRGYQLALIQERLRAARQHGCDVAVVETDVANGSARNVERAGFRVLYSKLNLTR